MAGLVDRGSGEGLLAVLPQAEVLNQIQRCCILYRILLPRLNLVHEPEAGPLCAMAEKVVLLNRIRI